jgi:hypothetical protein
MDRVGFEPTTSAQQIYLMAAIEGNCSNPTRSTFFFAYSVAYTIKQSFEEASQGSKKLKTKVCVGLGLIVCHLF